ncbi:MAG: globin domain-containing protein, partial [Pseudomonadota bacterium]
FRMTRMDELEGAPARRLSFHPEVVTYLAPEQHKKLMITQKTDQYSLALLAIEMLQGEPPVLVKSLSDIKRKEKFFNKPEAFAKNWSARSPRLRKVLYKMLSKDPKDRYASMQEIVDELETAKNTREDSRRIAKQSYAALAPHKLEVLGDFYDMLFARFPALKVHFKRDIKSPALLRKLDRAILYLINFRPEDMAHEPTILTGIRESHAKYGLLEQDFDNFAECLLDALHHVGETSEETQEAWRTTLAPGLAYMKDCCVAEFEIEAEVAAGAETQDTSEPAEVSD